ncbi:MAG: hypothetical protein ABSF45_09785 [Terriglobia bacterium]|jgi:hypothetical protein
MARAPFLSPTVFVGCPYARPFDFRAFRETLERLPIAWYYADTSLRSKHLLSILTTYIQAVDYCIFDLSFWNPNVSLELGLAEGVGKDYYILVNRKQSKDVPSDIKGIQRIEYSSIESRETDGLLPSIARYLVRDQTHPRHIWDNLSSTNRDKKFYLSLAILAHFRENKRLPHEDITRLSKGLYLRKDAQDEVLDILEDQKLISATGSRRGAKLAKRIYPRELRLA